MNLLDALREEPWALPVLLVSTGPLALQIAIGAVAYLVFSRLLGTIPLDELLRLRRRSEPDAAGPPSNVEA